MVTVRRTELAVPRPSHRDPRTMQLTGHTAQRDTREEWSTLRSKETLTQATTWMTLEDAAPSERRHSWKDKNRVIPLI